MKLTSEYRLIQDVIDIFCEICSIPHGSGNTKGIRDYLCKIADDGDFRYRADEAGNVIVWKPASQGRENCRPLALQAHIDMVCNKDKEKEFDFCSQGIEICLKDEFLYADRTTLGADNGIGVSMMIAILKNNNIVHPPLEMIFTNDEEVGLDGAAAIDLLDIEARRFINLDSEEEGCFIVCSAGGIFNYMTVQVAKNRSEGHKCTIEISGLCGGHSGIEIDNGRINAIKLAGEILCDIYARCGFRIAGLQGGKSQNIIASECSCDLLFDLNEDISTLKITLESIVSAHIGKNILDEEGIEISVAWADEPACESVIDHDTSMQIASIMRDCIYGVQQYSEMIPDTIDTSINPGVVTIENGCFTLASAIRSSSKDGSEKLIEKLNEFASKHNCISENRGGYPAWEFNKNSQLRKEMIDVFVDMYGYEPKITGVHGGLECGFFSDKIEGLDCISIGPDIIGAHSPDEHVSLKSIRNVYEFLIKAIGNMAD